LQEMGALHCEQRVFIVESQFSLRWAVSAQWCCCTGNRAMTFCGFVRSLFGVE
jgi:hypothetical protein